MPPADAGDDGCLRELTPAQAVAPRPTVAPPGYALATGAGSALGSELSRLPGLRRRRLRSLVVLTRPRQWVKNLLVVAAPTAAGVVLDGGVSERVALAVAAFCLLSGGTYVVNDVLDAREDRVHPRKRRRPVAAGEIEPGEAIGAAVVLMLAGLGLCLVVRPLLLGVGAAYLAVTLTYTLVLRRIVVLDVGAIAGGFVLRAAAGGVAAPVALSRSFVMVVTFGALYVSVGKRHAELARARRVGIAGRSVLERYSLRRLRQALAACAALAFAAYGLWAFVPASPWRLATVVPFGACLVRYGVLLRRGEGEAPEELLFADRPLAVLALTWAVAFALSVHAAG